MQLVEAKKQDWKVLLIWRNDELTRQNSISSDIISEEEHKKWFFNSLENENRKIYIVKENNDLLGTVRVDYVGNEKTISWTVAPNFRGKGIGKEMVKLLVDSLSGKVIAVIKENNSASIKIAEYAGLVFYKKEKEILYYTQEK